MKRRLIVIINLALVFLLSGITQVKSQAVLDIESGVVFSGYNDVRIPGTGGTLFSMSEELEASPELYLRLRGSYTIAKRHTLSLLYAPLSIKSTGSVPKEIIFEGVVFPANADLEGIYKFNSYRLTYRYDIVKKPKIEFGLGFTAKIRDAKISLETQGLYSEKVNVGFVPIINFRFAWNTTDKLSLIFDGDALAAPQGRAEDIFISANYRVSDRIGLKAGYRILEGGADNSEVYNFALFHYAAVGLMIYL
jgi:hypothetical protein